MPSVTIDLPDTAVHVADYGAVGDGTSDDYAALQAAVTAALASKRPLQLDAKTYAISQPLVLAQWLAVIGAPRSGNARTVLKAIAPMRAVMELRGGLIYQVSDVELEANRLAKYGLMLLGCSFGTFTRVTVRGATHDGVHLAKYDDVGGLTIDDANVWSQLTSVENGTLFLTPDLRSSYVAGEGTPRVLPAQAVSMTGASAALTSASTSITFSGLDLTTLDLRPGDPLRVVNSGRDHFLVVEVLSATELRVSEPATATASACSFAIGRGDGYHEEEGDGDNNLSRFDYGLWRSNAGKGLQIQGSYGCRMFGGQVEYCPFWGILVGVETATYVSTSFSALFVGTYFEAISRKPFYLRSALGLRMDALVAPEGEALYDTPNYPNTPYVRGIRIGDAGIEAIGTIRNHVPSTATQDAVLRGHNTMHGVIVQPPSTSGPNDWAGNYWRLRTFTEPLTLAGTPTIALRAGKWLFVANEGPMDVTLQDEGTLAGSKLRLGAATLTLSAGQVVQLFCDGSYWTRPL